MKGRLILKQGIVLLVATCALAAASLCLVACAGGTADQPASASAEASASAADAAESSASASSAEASSEESAEASSAASASAAADPAEKFVGSWLFSAAESQGVTMAGNFGQMFDLGDSGALTINADGTGIMNFGDGTAEFNWAASGGDAIDVTVASDTELTIQQAFPITYQDDALFMDVEQDGQAAKAIFTKDGVYAKAKVISMDGATPITSEADLLGTWVMVGMNMAGVSMYGTEESLTAANGGMETFITFEEGGVAKMSATEGTWTVGPEGATLTSEDITGTHTVPVMKIGDTIAVDYSGMWGDVEFITVLAKK